MKIRTYETPRDKKGWQRSHRVLEPQLKRLVVGTPILLEEFYTEVREDLGVCNTMWLTLNDVTQTAWHFGYRLLQKRGDDFEEKGPLDPLSNITHIGLLEKRDAE
jgi:hypothetical protein